ncbi:MULTISPECIES: cobalt-precorrin-6A reductase [unclassified Streptomyces]|uniref:cobalt-precorrin-6A reductase n=1 Tax=unclassified Streptomyces TaxID=2593676 RepID=UPI001BEB79F7|nr:MULTISPECIES: cobalt-precorrin-6A reductase [unclassified Streptomyces]MBT2405099.1 cobalt-precorrin-6A reductase [Streptomyces sp. ISL-21]MBT2454699.1 cobalt-precorrin-6A reductase [Streptomyces sp. ISL-86]MBT2610825.1 cobalt-precorrin-6A reductase [Streptomyces sp. ISL-87]
MSADSAAGSAAGSAGSAAGPAGESARGHVLILGGTTEARRLAEALERAPYRVTTSLAGRVTAPVLPPGETRIGGFGGPAGLAAWITAHRVTHLVDATHPFAERMSFNAAEAAALSGVPLLALRRPGWSPGPGDDWHFADSLTEAAALLPGLGSRAFLTTGRMGLHSFAHLTEPWFLVRSVDPPAAPAPPRLEVLLARGPFTLDDERELLARHRIDVLVTKDSGGSATAPKLTAAREAGIPVLVVRRPPVPRGVAETSSVEQVRHWLDH